MMEKKEILEKLVERKKQLMQLNDVEFLKWAKDKFWINTGYVEDYIEKEEFRWEIVRNSLRIDGNKVKITYGMYQELKWLIKPNGRWNTQEKCWIIEDAFIRNCIRDFVVDLSERVWGIAIRLKRVQLLVNWGNINPTYLLENETAPMYPDAQYVGSDPEERQLWEIYHSSRIVSV